MGKILNIAHRGACGYYPENTMKAFKKAIELGADGIELDVQMTKDSRLVVIHDETVNRTTNGQGYVKELSFAEIRKLDVGKGEKIPELIEVLELLTDTKLILNIELKNSIVPYEGMEKKVIDLIEKFNMKEKVIISSFNHYSIKYIKEINQEIKTGALVEACLYEPDRYVKDLNVDFYHPQFKSLNESIINNLKKNSIGINTYTVNKVEDMKKLIKLKVNGIITNYPDKLKELLEEMRIAK